MLKLTIAITLGRVRESIAHNNTEAIVLGCAALADLMAQLSEESGLPVIDDVAAGVTFAEALVNNWLSTSKIGAYARD